MAQKLLDGQSRHSPVPQRVVVIIRNFLGKIDDELRPERVVELCTDTPHVQLKYVRPCVLTKRHGLLERTDGRYEEDRHRERVHRRDRRVHAAIIACTEAESSPARTLYSINIYHRNRVSII